MSNPTSPAGDQAALDRALVRGIFAVTLFAALSSIAKLGQDAVVAWRYGTGPMVDAYYLMLSLINWPLATALTTMTLLIPPAEAAMRWGDAGDARRFRAELLGCTALTALIAWPLAWWALRTTVTSRLGGLSAPASALAEAGVTGIAVAVPVGMVGALLAAWLIASGRHLLTLLEAMPPVILMTLVFTLPSAPVLFWGTTVGLVVQVLAMAWMLRRGERLPAPRPGLSSPAWRSFGRGAFTLLIGLLLFSLFPLVDPFFAARLGEGAVASISYANRLVLGLQGLVGLGLHRVGMPLLAQLMADSHQQGSRAALRWTIAAGAAGALIGLIVAALADPIVALLFERGRFTVGDRELVAGLLRWGMLQMPPFLAWMTLTMALASRQSGSLLALAAASGLVMKLVLSSVLVSTHGMVGLQVATAGMYLIIALIAAAAIGRAHAEKA